MAKAQNRTICWVPIWNEACRGVGLEHLLLRAYEADSVVLGFDAAHGAFRLNYSLVWDDTLRLRDAKLSCVSEDATRSLRLQTDGAGHWYDGAGQPLPELAGCIDIDIWPTPFTNSFPIWRRPLAVGERQEFLMAWVSAPELTVQPKPQAYTRLAERCYLFESLDGSGFQAELPVDEHGLVLDYPDLFQRVRV